MWMEQCCQLLKVENDIFLVVDGEVYQDIFGAMNTFYSYLWCILCCCVFVGCISYGVAMFAWVS
jgi:hypothetical protein